MITIEVIYIILYEQANPDAMYEEVLEPLSAAIDFLKTGNREDAKNKLEYATANLPKYSTMGEDYVISGIRWRMEMTNALLGVSPENIGKAYELASIKRILKLSKIKKSYGKRSYEVKERLTKLATDAKTTGGELELLSQAYDDALKSINNNSEYIRPILVQVFIPRIDEILAKLGCTEPK